ncbi:MAG: hypothetical protein ACTSPV_00750 [Candidatus Hodarchaeales archaeon]
MAVVDQILKAQNFLKKQYGEEGYKKMVKAMQERVEKVRGNMPSVEILAHITNDKDFSPEVRLVALAALGE